MLIKRKQNQQSDEPSPKDLKQETKFLFARNEPRPMLSEVPIGIRSWLEDLGCLAARPTDGLGGWRLQGIGGPLFPGLRQPQQCYTTSYSKMRRGLHRETNEGLLLTMLEHKNRNRFGMPHRVVGPSKLSDLRTETCCGASFLPPFLLSPPVLNRVSEHKTLLMIIRLAGWL